MSSAEPDVKSIFGRALECPSNPERAAFLDQACKGNAALRAEVEALLDALDKAGNFMPLPATRGDATSDRPPTEGPGTRIGVYKALQVLGEGGMGTVFMAEQQEPVRRLVALKVIKPGMDSKEVLVRFEAERQAIALMDHPNIAKVLDAGSTESGRPFFVMELVKGVPITKYCDDHQLSPKERLELFVPICQAIQHAHQKGVIHRDIKPSNVLVASYDGKPVPKVIDFGVAKAMGQRLTDKTLFTGFGHVVGTLEYMSPEQAELNALDIDTRSDVYALGVLLYELLTGSTPLSRKRLKQAALEEALRLIREEEPPKPSTRLSTADALPSIAAHRKTEPAKLTKLMRGELDWMVMQALEKDRGRRYESASAFAADVQRYLHDEPVAACPPSAWYRVRKFARRHKTRLRVTLAAAAVLLVALVGAGWVLRDRAIQESTRQEELTQRRLQTERAITLALARAEQLVAKTGLKPTAKSPEAEAILAIWDQAAAALGQADAALKTGSADEQLQDRLLAMHKQVDQGRGLAEHRFAQLKRQEKLLQGLEEARMAYATLVDDHYDNAGAVAQYAAAFAAYGLEVRPGETQDLARRISAEEPAVAEALIVALDIWANAAGPLKTEWSTADLRALAIAADSDPWRRKVLAASPADDGEELFRLSAQARRMSLTPANLQSLAWRLGGVPQGGRQEAMALLRWARSQHPADFWIAFALGTFLRPSDKSTPADIEESIGCYRVALALRPDASAAYCNLGAALHAKNELDEAMAAFRKAIEINPNYAMAHMNLGIALRDKNQLDQAIASIRKAIDLNPKFAAAYNNLGRVLLDKKQVDEAIAAYLKAIEIEPRYANAHYNLGNALRSRRQFDEAIAAFRKAIEINPNFAFAHNSLGNTLRDNKNLDQAIAAYRKAIAIDPKNANYYNNLANALRDNKQLDQAIAAYRKAIEINPKNSLALNNLGIALRSKNQFDEAIALHRKAIEVNPNDANAFNNLGTDLWAKNQWDEAIAAFRKAIDINPKDANAYTNLGNVLQTKKQFIEAIAAHRKAIAIDPNHAGAYNNLGLALLGNNQVDDAIAAHCKAIEINPKYGNAYINLGIAFQANHQLAEAVAIYGKAIELEPKNANRLDFVAELLANHPEPSVRAPGKAVELASKAVELAPKVGICWKTLGVAHYRAGDWNATMAALDKSMQLTNGGDAGGWFFLAMAHWQLGDKEKAREWHDRAVKWMDDNRQNLEKSKATAEEFGRCRAEAAELLGISKGMKDEG